MHTHNNCLSTYLHYLGTTRDIKLRGIRGDDNSIACAALHARTHFFGTIFGLPAGRPHDDYEQNHGDDDANDDHKLKVLPPVLSLQTVSLNKDCIRNRIIEKSISE